MKLIIVGNEGGTNVGASFRRAAEAMGIDVRYCRASDAFAGPAVVRRLSWRVLGRRPPRLGSFSDSVVEAVREFQPDALLATGTAPLSAAALQEIRSLGVTTVNYLTDDPWNRTFRGAWLFGSIRMYDWVFSPRRSNIDDLRALGCAEVQYLPFAYDPDLFFPESSRDTARHDVIFAAAADRDRIPYVQALIKGGYRLGLFGVLWDRFPQTRRRAGPWLPPAELRPEVGATHVALCLVRRANRDGHVMRTYELAAMQACMLVEDTAEHREILGDTVLYFGNVQQMIEQLDRLLGDAGARRRSAHAVHARITEGANTYADRLRTMLARVLPSMEAGA